MKAIIKRELKAYFTSPLGYAVLTVLALVFGFIYTICLAFFPSADITSILFGMIFGLFVVSPLLTMRLLANERRQKTDQLLMSAPVNISMIVLGKFFAALLFFCVFFVEVIVFNFVYLFFGATIDWMVFFGNIVGLVFLSAALIAVGLFFSALTEEQLIAAVLTYGALLILMFINGIVSIFNNVFYVMTNINLPSILIDICDWISFSARYQSFTQGIFDLTNITFFISVIAVFLFMTVRVVDRKRWA